MKNENWFKKNGFDKNPLSIKPESGTINGYETALNKLKSDLGKKQGIWKIKGNYGTGKTTLLKKLLKKYKITKKVIYLSHNRIDGSMNVRQLLIKSNNFFKRIFGIVPNDIILLIDESTNLNSKEVSELIHYYNSNSSIYFFSVACVKNISLK